MQLGFVFVQKMFQDKCTVIAIVIVITFNAIVIDYNVILLIRNRNRACGK